MKKLVLISAVLAVCLALPAPSLAKELTKVSVCGSEGCNDTTDQRDLAGLPMTGEQNGQLPPPAPFYEVRFTIDRGADSWTTWYVPSAGLLASRDPREGIVWTPFRSSILHRLARGVKPFPTPEITSVTVGGRTAEDPSSYLGLFTVSSAGTAIPQGLPDWQPVVFHSKRPSPWTVGPAIYYSPSSGLLQRGIDIVRLPSGMADDVRAGSSLDGARSSWLRVFLLVGGGLLLAVAAVAAVARLRRRGFTRRQPRTA